MYTYFLCDDNDTIYKVKFSIKEDDKEYYLSLLDNYLNEFVFIEENISKKLIEKESINKENKKTIANNNGILVLERTEIINIECIEEYLPYIVTIKTRKYNLLRSYTISILLNFLFDEEKVIERYESLLRQVRCYSIEFSSLYKFFYNDANEIKEENDFDYKALYSLFKNLDASVIEKYSISRLRCFDAMDDADRELAEGIITDASSNKVFLKKLNSNFLFI